MTDSEFNRMLIIEFRADRKRKKHNPKIAPKCQDCIWAIHDGNNGICCMPMCKEGVK